MRRACLAVSIGALVVLPLAYSPATVDPAAAPRMFLLGFLLAAAGVWILVDRTFQEPPVAVSGAGTVVLGFFTIYLLLAVSDIRVGFALADSLTDLTRILLWIALALVWLAILQGKECLSRIVRAATAGALLLALIGFLQFFEVGFGFILGHGVPSATMANKNLLASALVISLPLVFYVNLTDTRAWRLLSIVTTMLATFTIVVVEARASWLALIAAAVTVAILWRLIGRGTMTRNVTSALLKRRLLTLSAVVALTAIISIPAANRRPDGDTVAGRLEASIDFGSGSVAERLALWKGSLELIKERPLRGAGLGQWRIEQPRFASSALRTAGGDVFYQRPHNDFLWVGAELGIFGFIVYMGIFVAALVAAINRVRDATSTDARLQGVCIAGALIAYMAVASFSYPRERIVHLVLSALLIAAAIGPVAKAQVRVITMSRPLLSGILLFAGIVSMFVGFMRYQSEAHTARLWRAFAVHDFDRVEKEAQAAETFLYHIDPVSTPLDWYVGVAHLQKGDVEAAKVSMQRAARMMPYHPHVLANLAACYEQEGDHEKAAELYERTVALSPKFHDALVNLGAVYFNEGRYDDALAVLERAAKLKRTALVDQYLERVQNAIRSRDSEAGH